jgi:phosphoribosyl-ATP pyrophosphohydrolase/phosphoribosyl-AMP cyclohydrolase
MRLTADDIDRPDFDKGDGLLPAVVQDATDGAVLMVGWMDREALTETFKRGRVVFWSRSRRTLWEKGETSGHSLELCAVDLDCDRDTLLVSATPKGPVCHTGTATCFGDRAETPLADDPASFLGTLERLVTERLRDAPEGSYTARLAAGGIPRVAQKVGEEGVEVALAAVGGDRPALVGEAADLVYHLLVLLRLSGASLADVGQELSRRHAAGQRANSGAG